MRRDNTKEKGDDMSGLKKLIAAAGAGAILVSGLAANVSAVESYDPYSYDRWGDAVASQVGYTAEYFVDGQSINGLAEVIEAMDGFNAEKASWQELLGLRNLLICTYPLTTLCILPIRATTEYW